MQEIVIITVVTKPGNIPYIYHSICDHPLKLKVHWALIFLSDQEKEHDLWTVKFKRSHVQNLFPVCHLFQNSTDAKCYTVRNWMLEMMEQNNALHEFDRHWVYFLDDDNIINPFMLGSIVSEERKISGINMLLFNQVCRDDHRRIELPGTISCLRDGAVGLNMVCARQGLLGPLRFSEYAPDPGRDFVEKLGASNADRKIWCAMHYVYNKYLD